MTTHDEEVLRSEIEGLIGLEFRASTAATGGVASNVAVPAAELPPRAASRGPVPQNPLSMTELVSAKADELSKIDHAFLSAAAEAGFKSGAACS